MKVHSIREEYIEGEIRLLDEAVPQAERKSGVASCEVGN